MTLIIKAITLKWAFSISDRLLTQKTTNGYNPFDAVSNKTILFFSSDAMVSISYTGSAYIGKIPTDRWISEKLCGLDLSEGNDFKLIVKSGKWKNLYNSIEYLTSFFINYPAGIRYNFSKSIINFLQKN